MFNRVHAPTVSKKVHSLWRSLHLSIMLMLVVNMSYLGVFFVAPTEVGATALPDIEYTLEGQKVDSSFTAGNICGVGDVCYAEGDSVPVKLTLNNLEVDTPYSMVVAHDYKNGFGIIGYDRFENLDSWNSTANSLSFTHPTVSEDESQIEYVLNFRALSTDVELKWLAVLGDNASDYGAGANIYFYLISGAEDENVGEVSVPIDLDKLVVDEEPGEPVCTLDEADYDHIIDLQNLRLVSNGMSGYASSTPAYDVSFVPDGQYSITLQAHDGYDGRSGVTQNNEQYKLVFFDENGLSVATSSPHADLADAVNQATTTQEVDTALQLTGVKTVKGVHAYYHNDDTGADGPNSLNAVCFGLNKLPDSAPVCGDGIINQSSEQCDGNSFSSGHEEGFTCDSQCKVVTVIPVCTLDAVDYDYIFNFEENILIASNLIKSKTNAVIQEIPEGNYSVTLQAFDAYYNRYKTNQDKEQYQLVFFDGGGLSVATSSPHTDLADGINYATTTEEVDTDLYVSGASSVKGVHAFYGQTGSNPHSVRAVCAGINKLPDIEAPACGDGIINQTLEKCDGSAFPGGYEEGFTCNSQCEIQAIAPVCTLDAADFDYIVDLQNVRLVSNGMPGYASSTPAYDVSFVPDGQYSVTLQAHDAYYGRSAATQSNEQYKLVFFDANGLMVATSSPHADLADGVNHASTTQEVDTALQLTGVDTVSGVHAYYHNDDTGAVGPNSLDAVCFGLNENGNQQETTYSWVTADDYGTCSVSCGGGTQTKAITCINDDTQAVVADTNCDANTKPVLQSQACNTQSCGGGGDPTPACGDGIINQSSEQCDGSAFPGGYEEGFTCNSQCEIQAIAPVCTLDAADFDYIVDLHNIKLLSDGSSGFASSTPAYDVSFVPDGQYSVTLQAHDAYYGRSGTTQNNEQYKLVFFDANGLMVATSSPHADLADGVNHASTTQEVDTALQLTGVDTVSGIHAYYHNTDTGAVGPNSLNAVCFGLNENEEEITYSWVTADDYGTCSVSCGGGTQTKAITCINDDTQAVVADTNCDANTKPVLQSQACNTQSCGGGGGGGVGGGGGGGYISFGITNPQIMMQCANGKVDITLTWLTTYSSDSRVVYDTTSHAGANLGIAPNYGYASSTVLNGTQVTGHSVVINGLEPNTYYYFRPVSKYNFSEVVGEEKPLTQTLSCAPGTNEVIVLGEEGAPVLALTNQALIPVVNPGAKGVEYEIVVTNNGDLPSFNTILKNILPEGFTYTDFGGDEWNWALGDLNPGQSKIVIVRVDIAPSVVAGHYISDASVRSDNHDIVTDPASIEVRTVIVLAETGFSATEFLFLLSLLSAFAGSSLFLRRKMIVKTY